MEFPNPCCRCGFCCLSEMCPSGIAVYGSGPSVCPALHFYDEIGGISDCALVQPGLVPVGDGCCILARAYKGGVEYDFASLPPDKKIGAVRMIRGR